MFHMEFAMKLTLMVMALLLAVATSGCAVTQPAPAVPLRIDEVAAMSTQGQSDAAVIAHIQQRGAAFVLTPQDFEQQRAAGVSEGVLRYLQGRGDGDQALRSRILSGRYPVPLYYGSSYLGYSYLGYHGGHHYYGGALHGNTGGHASIHHGSHHGHLGHHGGGHH